MFLIAPSYLLKEASPTLDSAIKCISNPTAIPVDSCTSLVAPSVNRLALPPAPGTWLKMIAWLVCASPSSTMLPLA